MDFKSGFTLWRELGQNRAGEAIAFPALTAIHYVHRLSAYLVFAALFWLIWRLWSVAAMRPTARWLIGLAVWQFVSGLTNVVLDWPLLAAVGHTGGAAALVVVMTSAIFSTRTTPETQNVPAFNTPSPTR
jgi:cytochrome c oxidase assembly protein subunit 15